MTAKFTTTVLVDSVTGRVSVEQSVEVHHDSIDAEGEEVRDRPSLHPGPASAAARPALRVVEAA